MTETFGTGATPIGVNLETFVSGLLRTRPTFSHRAGTERGAAGGIEVTVDGREEEAHGAVASGEWRVVSC
jgi:hypothetical protein